MFSLIILYTHGSVSVSMCHKFCVCHVMTSAYKYGITSAIKKSKFIRHIFTDTLPCVYKIIKLNIFFRPEEAMFGNWRKLASLLKKICSVPVKTQIT